MKLILDIIFLLLGFLFLIKGADYFVDGSSAIAKKLRVPSIVVGLTIVAVGTSLPELAVSSFAAAKGSNAIAVSNVIGSNIFNLLMVLGITALFVTINVKKSILKREMPFLVGITVLGVILAGDALWFGDVIGRINIFDFKYSDAIIGTVERIDGILLLVLFVGFIWWTVSYALKERKKTAEETEEVTFSNWKCAIFIIGGAVAIIAGGEIVVNHAKSLALAAGMSETLVGLTIVALGTSLPELVTSAVAGVKGEGDIAVGNVVGSNIANILLVLGMSATISPIKVTTMSLIDGIMSLIITVIVFVVAGTKKRIKRGEGIFLVLIYLCYMAYIICR
ncbi:MAG: calcium/sodium antiporter [Eubacterium sp.]